MFNPNYYMPQAPRNSPWVLPPHLLHLLQIKQFQMQAQQQQIPLQSQQLSNQFANFYAQQFPGQLNPLQVKQESNAEKSLLQELSRQQQQRVNESSNLFRELLASKKIENQESTASESGETSKNNPSIASRKSSNDAPKAKEYQELFQSLHQILLYLSQHADIDTMTQLDQARKDYCKNNEKLIFVWNALVEKYRNQEKTKEEMTKFVLRKSLKFMREQCWKTEKKIKKEENKKAVDEIFFQTYFDKETFEKILKERKEKERHGKKKNKADQIETLQDLIMPFRKKSVIKTMNNEFLKQIFSFEKFSLGFLTFISYYTVVALKDNAKKINNTARKIVLLIINDKFSVHQFFFLKLLLQNNSLKSFKRIPWLETWINKSEKVAEKFVHFISKKNFPSARELLQKRIKKELTKFENKKRSLSL